jgi:crotonobetainyl-CoA:carnitine CoA-transferase CaiB-like acyl-CoA transferase
MTGWGQSGPLAHTAGHDINYIALTGALDAIGRKGALPTPPLNLVGDYAGGSLYLALGILSALFERQQSNKGHVVDAAIVDGAVSLLSSHLGMLAAGKVSSERGQNLLDSGAPFYDAYLCADGRWISVGAIEAKFFEQLAAKLGLNGATLPARSDRKNWQALKDIFAAKFRERPAEEWRQTFDGSDCCATVVLSAEEAQQDPHMRERGTFISIDGVVQPAPAPRFSRSIPDRPRSPSVSNTPTEALSGWLDDDAINQMRQAGLFD